jgi:hypothetical protein
MDYLVTNLAELIDVLVYIVAAAAAIAALFKNPEVDGWMTKVRKVVDFLALNVGNAKNATGPKPVKRE